VRRVARRVEEDQRVLPEVQPVSVVHRHQPIRMDAPHRAEDVRLLRAEGLARAGHELRRIGEVFEAPGVHIHLGPRHFREQKAGAAGVVQVDVRHNQCVDVRGLQAKRAHGIQDATRVPRGPRLDDGLAVVVDQVDRAEPLLLEHLDVRQVGFRVEGQALEGHRPDDCHPRHVLSRRKRARRNGRQQVTALA